LFSVYEERDVGIASTKMWGRVGNCQVENYGVEALIFQVTWNVYGGTVEAMVRWLKLTSESVWLVTLVLRFG